MTFALNASLTHSLHHMLLHCGSKFRNWWVSKTKENILLSNSIILYGTFDNRKHKYSLNHALLIALYSVYSKCLHDEKLCFDSFLSLLIEKVNIQREIAIKNNKLNQFYKIYGNLLQSFVNFSFSFFCFLFLFLSSLEIKHCN